MLIVEDEPAIQKGLIDVFVYNGYEVEAVADGQVALDTFARSNFDLILLDVMLPSVDGFTICNQIRKQDRRIPIMMLTAKTTEEDILNGMSLGADDYVSKPFSIRVLMARVEAVLRRSRKTEKLAREIRFDNDYVLDTENLFGRAGADGQIDDFTRREVDFLLYLLMHPDRPVGRDELLTEVWGYSKNSLIETRTVDIHVAKIRKKIEKDAKNPKILETVRGKGYKLNGVVS